MSEGLERDAAAEGQCKPANRERSADHREAPAERQDSGKAIAPDDLHAGIGDPEQGENRPTPGRHDSPDLVDAAARFLAAAEPQEFIGGLAGALSPPAAGGDRGAAAMLRLLGAALMDALDEESLFEEAVEVLERKSLRSEGSVVVAAALLARIISGPALQASPEPDTAAAAGLVAAAVRIVRAALDTGAERSWRSLPKFAAAVARQNAQRDLPIANLATALPRLWAQSRPAPHDVSTPRTEPPQPGVIRWPRRMILNGPVEIVILGR